MPVINVRYQAGPGRPDPLPSLLVELGPMISVDVLPPSVVEEEAASSGREVGRAENLMALIDTGASVTGVEGDVLRSLGYPPVGVALMNTPSGAVRTEVYVVKLVMPSMMDPRFPPNVQRIVKDYVHVLSITKLGSPRPQYQYRALIGRDVLADLFVAYNGSQALITLAY
ncbi:MAG: hypothetical protein ACP5KM_03520 [Conexivisphaera sp.]|jgi:hypothetical protein